MKQKSLHMVMAIGLLAITVCALPSAAWGKNGSDDATSSSVSTSTHQETEVEATETETHKTESTTTKAKADNKQKLTDAKLKVCQLRQSHIQSKITNIVAHANKQLGVFDAIAARTTAFAETHDAKPANYTALTKAVADARTAAVAGLAAMKTDQTFSCTGDAHGQADAFKTQLKSEIALLKVYKTSIRNLIVGVKSSATSTDADKSTSGANND